MKTQNLSKILKYTLLTSILVILLSGISSLIIVGEILISNSNDIQLYFNVSLFLFILSSFVTALVLVTELRIEIQSRKNDSNCIRYHKKLDLSDFETPKDNREILTIANFIIDKKGNDTANFHIFLDYKNNKIIGSFDRYDLNNAIEKYLTQERYFCMFFISNIKNKCDKQFNMQSFFKQKINELSNKYYGNKDE